MVRPGRHPTFCIWITLENQAIEIAKMLTVLHRNLKPN